MKYMCYIQWSVQSVPAYLQWRSEEDALGYPIYMFGFHFVNEKRRTSNVPAYATEILQ